MVVIHTGQNGMPTIEIGGPGMKGREGHTITVDAVEAEAPTTVRRFAPTNPPPPPWRHDVN